MEAAMSVTNMSAVHYAIATASREGVSVILTRLHRAWPLAGLAIALIANVAWIGLLAYGLAKLF
jgi:hypothetical protein